jgi:hypothetical protein
LLVTEGPLGEAYGLALADNVRWDRIRMTLWSSHGFPLSQKVFAYEPSSLPYFFISRHSF